jgi:hypothetical protein
MISGGYTHIIDLGPAVYLDFSTSLDYALFGLHAVYGFKGAETHSWPYSMFASWYPLFSSDPNYYLRIELMVGGQYTFDLNKVGLMPFVQAGIGYDNTAKFLYIGLSVRAGCTVTFRDLKGLFASTSYQFNLLDRHMVSVGIGYGF